MKYIRLFLTLTLATTMLSCSGSSNNEPSEPQEETGSSSGGGIAGALGDLAKNLEEAAKAAEDMANKNVDPIDFRTLADMMPSNAAGLEQTENNGEKSAISGMATSYAQASYQSADGSKTITIKITDVGSMTSLVAFGMAWMNIDIDKESSSGFERTSKIEGHPALEIFTQGDGFSSGELTVVVANRYIVELTGSGIAMSDLKSTIDKINLSKLAAMKDEGVTTAN